jgi:trehalose 6-phosphate phosphatase
MQLKRAPLTRPTVDLLDHGSLFLDFDGTLVEIADRPDAVRVVPQLNDLMRRLFAQLDGRVAIISGRPVAQVREFLRTDLIVVGSHGMEFLDSKGALKPVQRPGALEAVLAAMDELANRYEGVAVEDKPLGVALHFRLCPEAESDCLNLATALAHEHRLHLQHGKMMIEVRATGGDKGTAIHALMREPEMVGTRPVFMGDDLTDEPGFAAAAELGGAGILVGDRRETAARYRLDGVEAAIAWLEAVAAKTA